MWLPRLNPAYQRRLGVSGYRSSSRRSSRSRHASRHPAVSILGEGRGASGKKAEAEERGERQCKEMLPDLSPLVLMGSRLESSIDIMCSPGVWSAVCFHTRKKRSALSRSCASVRCLQAGRQHATRAARCEARGKVEKAADRSSRPGRAGALRLDRLIADFRTHPLAQRELRAGAACILFGKHWARRSYGRAAWHIPGRLSKRSRPASCRRPLFCVDSQRAERFNVAEIRRIQKRFR